MKDEHEVAYVMIEAKHGRGVFVVVRELDAANALALIPVEHMDDPAELSIYDPPVKPRSSIPEATRLMQYITDSEEWRVVADAVSLVTLDEAQPDFD